MRLARRVLAAAAVLAVLSPPVALAGDPKYSTVSFTYMQQPRLPLPASASTFSVQGADALGVDPGLILVRGLERTPSGGDLQLQLSGSAPTAGQPTFTSFKSTIFLSKNNKPAPPAYDVIVHWASLPFQMPAHLTASTGGTTKKYDVGSKLAFDIGPKPEKTSSGMFQSSGSSWTLMESEPNSAPETVIDRVKWLVDNMCSDVNTVNGPAIKVTNGRARLKEKLKAATSPEQVEAVRQKLIANTVAQVNAVLERNLGRGERKLEVAFALVEDEKRFDQALAAFRTTAPDRFAAAATALQPVVDDEGGKARVRAAAAFDVAVSRLAAGELDAAAQAVARSRDLNAKEGDGWFGSSAKDLGKQLDRLEVIVKDRQAREANAAAATPGGAPPAAEAMPSPSGEAPAPQAAATASPAAAPAKPAAPAAARPWTELSDDEFMAAYAALMKDASDRKDQAELQKIANRVSQVMMKRMPKSK
jgi:hypothetical protein